VYWRHAAIADFFCVFVTLLRAVRIAGMSLPLTLTLCDWRHVMN